MLELVSSEDDPADRIVAFSSLLGGAPVPSVLVHAPSATISAANDAAESLVEVAAGALRGTEVGRGLAPGSERIVTTAMGLASATTAPVDFRFAVRPARSEPFDAEARLVSVGRGSGLLVAYATSRTDPAGGSADRRESAGLSIPARCDDLGLSRREREVLELFARGQRVRSIAAELFIAESTVRNHLSGVLRKARLRDQTDLFDWLRLPQETSGEVSSSDA